MTTKKQYIVPNTTSTTIQSSFICLVSSIRGGLGFGGKGDSIDPM